MVNPNIDYTSTNFGYRVFTKIHGISTHETICRIKGKMKVNVPSVPCDIGGGAHRH